MKLSTANEKILRNLQNKPTLSQTEQADDVGMSRSSYWRHIKDLEDAGVIEERRSEINARNIGLKIRANCVISIINHSSETRDHFERHIQHMPNVLECYATSGGKDYMLTVVARDIDNYHDIMSSSILDHPTIESAQTSFFMKEIKRTHKLPI